MTRFNRSSPRGIVALDANATTAVLPEAWEAYREAAALVGHPSSAHREGKRARACIELARAQVAECIGAHPDEIVFTSGGTEADALALYGVLRRVRNVGCPHVITSTIEHAAVGRNLAQLEAEGKITVTRVPVSREGAFAVDAVRAALQGDTRLVSLVAASNETGVLLPVREVVEACVAFSPNVVMHTDAVQLLPRERVNVRELGVHLLSFAGHKLGAVGGVGALYVQRGVELAPLWHGEGCVSRPGTDNVAGIASLAAALRMCQSDTAQARTEEIARLRDRLESTLCATLGDVEVIGRGSARLCNTLSIRFAGCPGDAVMMALDVARVAVSTGSACSSGAIEPSPILLGMGLSPGEAKEVVRYSLSPTTTLDDVDMAARLTVNTVNRIRGGDLVLRSTR